MPSCEGDASWHLIETLLARPQLFQGGCYEHLRLKISLGACCGLGEGVAHVVPLLLFPQSWSTDSQGHGAKTCARDKESPAPFPASFSCLLLSSSTLQNGDACQRPALLWGRGGLGSCFTYLLLELLLRVENVVQRREWEKKIETRNILLEHSWGLPSSRAVMSKNMQWWNYRVRVTFLWAYYGVINVTEIWE